MQTSHIPNLRGVSIIAIFNRLKYYMMIHFNHDFNWIFVKRKICYPVIYSLSLFSSTSIFILNIKSLNFAIKNGVWGNGYITINYSSKIEKILFICSFFRLRRKEKILHFPLEYIENCIENGLFWKLYFLLCTQDARNTADLTLAGLIWFSCQKISFGYKWGNLWISRELKITHLINMKWMMSTKLHNYNSMSYFPNKIYI